MFSGSPLFILTLTCLTKDAENVSKMLKARLEKVPAAPITLHCFARGGAKAGVSNERFSTKVKL